MKTKFLEAVTLNDSARGIAMMLEGYTGAELREILDYIDGITDESVKKEFVHARAMSKFLIEVRQDDK